MSINPREIPTGAVRFNTDSSKMEVYIGSTWMEVAVSESVPTGDRGVYAGDQEPGSNNISYLSLTTGGVAVDFGDLNFSTALASALSSRTRGIFSNGNADSPGAKNSLDFVTIATAGNATDFGDLTQGRYNGTGSSNQTRGIFSGGHNPGLVDTMDFVTIASTGNAIDFGNLSSNLYANRSCSNPTRLLNGGGGTPSNINVIQFVTISSTGNSVDFGDLTSAKSNLLSCSNSTRGFWIGGSNPSAINVIEFVTIASLGNAQDFGDSMSDFIYAGDGATASQKRGFFIDGGAPGSPGGVTDISSFNMIHQGNAFAFGDLNYSATTGGFLSNCHGGL